MNLSNSITSHEYAIYRLDIAVVALNFRFRQVFVLHSANGRPIRALRTRHRLYLNGIGMAIPIPIFMGMGVAMPPFNQFFTLGRLKTLSLRQTSSLSR